MLRYKLPVVPSRIDFNHVLNVPAIEQHIQLAGPHVKSVVIVIAAIRINPQAAQIVSSGKHEWRIGHPVGFVSRIAECCPEHLHEPGVSEAAWQSLAQRGHVCCDRYKHFWILEGKSQRAVAAHGNPADRPPGACSDETELLLHLGNEVTDKEVLVPHLAIFRIYVKRLPGLGRDDDELAHLLLFP